MSASLSTTRDYHASSMTTLGWELTVCNALADPRSPLRRFVPGGLSFGRLLYEHLARFIPVDDVRRIIEVGGGYGFLMRDFMARNPRLEATMLDVSPVMLREQGHLLRGRDVGFVERDFFELDGPFLSRFEMAVLNECIGDFPALCDVPSRSLETGEPDNIHLERARYFFTRYALPAPQNGMFNFNLGAAEALERLCTAGIPYIYLSEHSAEATVPPALAGLVDISCDGNPRRIALKGHFEYTIKFSHLESIARVHGYAVVRGPYADFLLAEPGDELRFIMRARASKSGEQEMIRQFIEDLCEYEYLLIYHGDHAASDPTSDPKRTGRPGRGTEDQQAENIKKTERSTSNDH